ncbi:MAG: cysteine-rich CWC family protein [Chlorobiaceae bacterium]|nr:cysteine-rich CWC family protein [Chlorobiaceae bacterium]
MPTPESHSGTPRSVTCPMCGQQFTCGLSSSCWCATRIVPDEVRAWLAARYETCVCSICLDRLVEEGVPEG